MSSSGMSIACDLRDSSGKRDVRFPVPWQISAYVEVLEFLLQHTLVGPLRKLVDQEVCLMCRSVQFHLIKLLVHPSNPAKPSVSHTTEAGILMPAPTGKSLAHLTLMAGL